MSRAIDRVRLRNALGRGDIVELGRSHAPLVAGQGDLTLGADTVPKAVSYTDHDTVLAVQKALKAQGYDPGPLDGLFGPKTSKAIKALQKDVGAGQSGVVDYGVLQALGVPAPAYSPTTTTAGRSASAAAQDADEVASHAQTAADVQQAAQQVAAANATAVPPPSPAVQTKVAEAQHAAATAKTPAEVAAAKEKVQDAAKAVVSATGFWGQPAWTGSPVNRLQGAAIGGGALAILGGLAMTFLGGGKKRKRHSRSWRRR